MMNHWIDREIRRLKRLIERANEKGWRAQLLHYIDQRELLRTPDEQDRLLKEIPGVISDTEEASDVAVTTTANSNSEYQEKEPERSAEVNEIRSDTRMNIHSETGPQRPAEDNGIRSNTDIIEIDNNEVDPSDRIHPEVNFVDLDDDDDDDRGSGGGGGDDNDMSNSSRLNHSFMTKTDTKIDVAEIPVYSWEWHYVDPNGKEQGPFPLDMMRKWSEKFFDGNFKVWRTGQSRADAILLKDILHRVFF